MSAKVPGRIITFYSYKGGTGRSMALANVAWILASNGKRVLMVDWDLEAPGLHRYFHPFLQDKNLASSSGIIDLVMSLEAAAIKPPGERQSKEGEPDNKSWYLSLAEIEKYTQPLAWTFPKGGVLDLLPAGRQDDSYAARTNSFDWARFYDKFGGGVFLEAVKNNMRKHYDYVLIDSRTGVSDIAGVCTIQMPDWLVVCFTLNIQSIEGSAAIAGTVRKERSRADYALERPALRIFPVPMRVDYVEKERLETARESATKKLSTFLDHLPERTRREYWGSVEVPYVPFYAFEEVLATIADAPALTNSLLASLERLTKYLTDGEITAQESLSKEDRDRLKDSYMAGLNVQSVTTVLTRRPEFRSLADKVTTQHKAWLETKRDQGYLLSPSLAAQLRESIDLFVPLLQDGSFHEFWDASQRRIQRRHFVGAFLWGVAVVIALAGSLASTLWASQVYKSAPKLIFLTHELIQFLIAILAGSLGAAIGLLMHDWQLFSSDRFEQRGSGLKRFFLFVLDLLNGALTASALRFALDTGAFGMQVMSQPIALMVIAGYIGRRFVPSTLQLLIATGESEKERRKIENTLK